MTTRSFNLLGVIYQEPAEATITINGTQVYQGSLAGPVKDPDVYEEQEMISVGSYTLNDSADVWVPVVVTLTSGQIDLGMFEWNYAWVLVPGSDPEQWIQDPDEYVLGRTAEQCYCNRRNELINGATVPDAGTDIPIMMHAGDTVTFETFIFAGPSS